jgi:hypothetical protein
MRRIPPRLGSLAAAALLTFAIPQPVYASTGILVINDTSYIDPVGCHPVDGEPLYITNRTDSPLSLHYGENCSGAIVLTVAPGGYQVSELEEARSFRIK